MNQATMGMMQILNPTRQQLRLELLKSKPRRLLHNLKSHKDLVAWGLLLGKSQGLPGHQGTVMEQSHHQSEQNEAPKQDQER